MRHTGQYEIFNPEDYADKSVLIVGAGGIWSTTAYGLAQMWIQNITVVDYDNVEDHNVATQFYKEAQAWTNKIQALRDNIKEFTGVEIEAIDGKFTPEMCKWKDIVIMWVDNMATRKQIAESVGRDTTRVIDCRMKREFFEIYMFIPEFETDLYLTKWYPDEEADPTSCTEKWVSYNCLGIASIICRLVKGIIMKEKPILDTTELTVDLHNLIISR